VDGGVFAVLLDLLEILQHAVAGAGGAAIQAVAAGARRPAMEVGEVLGDLVDVVGGEFAAIGDLIQPRAVRELAHAHRIIDDGTVAVEAGIVDAAGDAHHRLVEFRREPAVQAQFLVAVETPLLQCAEIQEAEIDRLLDLVGIGACQHHPGDVRLDDLEAFDRMRKARRLLQGGNESGLGVEVHVGICRGSVVHHLRDEGMPHGRIQSTSPMYQPPGMLSLPGIAALTRINK
jgi:hypothetical protein